MGVILNRAALGRPPASGGGERSEAEGRACLEPKWREDLPQQVNLRGSTPGSCGRENLWKAQTSTRPARLTDCPCRSVPRGSYCSRAKEKPDHETPVADVRRSAPSPRNDSQLSRANAG